ncbi:Uncharacterized protein TCAP_02067 [Tolypocladium capitatum]|uniref:Extracellular serine-rich protein n=1 Tax=Tolypocladium capitatum TaxID=45235 RepID=A0A2K3QKD7_9HYPO|nr:Uncharacterized protein TCAP_02067 [Tolypocladium capitatum]
MYSPKLSAALGTVWALGSFLTAAAITVDSTILVIARNDADARQATVGLDGYGIPYEKLLVSQPGTALPTLNSSPTQGRYGGIITVNSDTNRNWDTAVTQQQWSQLYAYQEAFQVRMVRLNEDPRPEFGVAAVGSGGCCDGGVEQRISLTNTTAFPGANLRANQGVSTLGLFHFPASITRPGTTWEVASYEPAGSFNTRTTAAVINSVRGRQQMVWFIGWAAADWSATSTYLQHAYIHWVTRSLFSGKRKVHLNTQVDDVHLETDIYHQTGVTFKIRTADLDAHVAWQKNLNARLPAGSDFWLEMGHNGNGDFIGATVRPSAVGVCTPQYAVDYPSPSVTETEWMKPPGTGADLWPAEFERYGWTESCARLDEFASWFLNQANRDAFAHVSHTFTHEELNNATYHDASREIAFNQAWFRQMGIDQAARFSPKGLIPPAITGLHNADVIKAWMDNGIIYVVGDNTRPVLRNAQNKYWPLASTVESNGREGLTIIPRYATNIFYDCDKGACCVQQWRDTSTAAHGDFAALLNDERDVNVRNLLGLQADPYMFHQANLRQIDMDTITVGSQTDKMSLIMSWVEIVAQELYRLTNWPITSLKHDDIAAYFLDRKTLDDCQPKAAYNYAADGRTVESVTVTARDNACRVPVPVTFPSGLVQASNGNPTLDQVGSEPPITWLRLSGSPVTLRLLTPVPL